MSNRYNLLRINTLLNVRKVHTTRKQDHDRLNFIFYYVLKILNLVYVYSTDSRDVFFLICHPGDKKC